MLAAQVCDRFHSFWSFAAFELYLDLSLISDLHLFRTRLSFSFITLQIHVLT